jgi:hypothetical protein
MRADTAKIKAWLVQESLRGTRLVSNEVTNEIAAAIDEVEQLKALARRMLDGHTLDANCNAGDCDDCDARVAEDELRRLL